MSETDRPVLVPVLPNHRFDEDALCRYLKGKIPGAEHGLVVRQFQGGQSNPTFHLQAGDHAYVLRKKPPGKLLPSAHAVDREFRVQKALAGSGVPVAAMHFLCEDDSVIGQMFYVMEYVDGRIFSDRLLPNCTPQERTDIVLESARVLARLHQVDYRAVGLEGFGKGEGYIARQVKRWSSQYAASATDVVPEMDHLIRWLGERVPERDEITIAHGDFRLGNLVYHPSEPKVLAVLDWELATIGHPLSDLAYSCLAWRMPSSTGRGFSDLDYQALGIPKEADYVAEYCRLMGRTEIPDWDFFVIFSLFRIAAIIAGVYRRGLEGNASDARATEFGPIYKLIAKTAWSMAQSSGA